MSTAAAKVIDVRYRANRKTVTLKNASYHGIRIRESDSATVIHLMQPHVGKHIAIDIGHLDTLWVGGKQRKLRSPGAQHKYREAELKHLLEGRKLDDWTDPYLRAYGYEGIKARRSPFMALVSLIVSGGGLLLMSLPALACLSVFGGIAYMVWKLFVGPMH